MSTTTQYIPRDFRRVCDECGVLFNRSRLHRKGPWILCDDCDQPGDRIREQEDAAIARQRPFLIRPVPNAKPQNWFGPYDWLLEEARVFNLVLAVAPARNPAGASDPAAAAWASVYLADVLSRGTRPSIWLTSGAVKLRALVTYLLGVQYGSPTGPAAAATDPRYGGFLVSGAYLTATVAAAGLAFVKTAAALGDSSLLTAADRCATFLRHAQCGDLQVSAWTVFPAGGGPYRTGGLATGVSDATGLQVQPQALADAGAALWFLTSLEAVRGASVTYGDAAATATFSAATAATLSVMISELAGFISTGPFDSSAAGANITGLSTTKPQASYSPAINGGGGTASWTFTATVPGSAIAMATLGVYLALGLTAQVSAVLAWLAAFTANPANATPTTNTPQQTLNAITGTYVAANGPATTLTATAPFTEGAGALYDLAALGILAPVLAATNAAGLRNARAAVSVGEQFLVTAADVRYPGTLGRLGLGMQPNSAANTATPDVLLAAQFAAVYNYVNP